MLHETPLRNRHEAWVRQEAERRAVAATAARRPGAATGHQVGGEVAYVGYGPSGEPGDVVCAIPGAFGEVELEYAAIRRGAGLLDCPHRGTLRVTGGERHGFLDSMLTQALKDLRPGRARESFWLSRQGRIMADLLLVELDDALLIDVDIHQAAATAQSLDAFIFTEDVALADASSEQHHLALHGPAACAVLGVAAGRPDLALAPLEAIALTIGAVPVAVARRDQVGEAGLEIIVARDRAEAVWNALLAAGDEHGRRIRPVGWFAFNTARIEAGTPLFNIDFGPTNLPHETGVLEQRVSFTKGCYLGQEIVARMQNLGRPKRTLVGLRPAGDRLPVAEGQVFGRADGALADPIGIVTSSTLSPMLAARPLALAMIATAHAEPGTTVLVNAEGEQVEATVAPLRAWPAPSRPPGNAG